MLYWYSSLSNLCLYVPQLYHVLKKLYQEVKKVYCDLKIPHLATPLLSILISIYAADNLAKYVQAAKFLFHSSLSFFLHPRRGKFFALCGCYDWYHGDGRYQARVL